MSRASVKKFYELVKSDDKIRKQIINIDEEIRQDNNKTLNDEYVISQKIIPIAKKNHLDFTAEEFIDYTKEQILALDEDDLLNVSGGLNLAGKAVAGLFTFMSLAAPIAGELSQSAYAVDPPPNVQTNSVETQTEQTNKVDVGIQQEQTMKNNSSVQAGSNHENNLDNKTYSDIDIKLSNLNVKNSKDLKKVIQDLIELIKKYFKKNINKKNIKLYKMPMPKPINIAGTYLKEIDKYLKEYLKENRKLLDESKKAADEVIYLNKERSRRNVETQTEEIIKNNSSTQTDQTNKVAIGIQSEQTMENNSSAQADSTHENNLDNKTYNDEYLIENNLDGKTPYSDEYLIIPIGNRYLLITTLDDEIKAKKNKDIIIFVGKDGSINYEYLNYEYLIENNLDGKTYNDEYLIENNLDGKTYSDENFIIFVGDHPTLITNEGIIIFNDDIFNEDIIIKANKNEDIIIFNDVFYNEDIIIFVGKDDSISLKDYSYALIPKFYGNLEDNRSASGIKIETLEVRHRGINRGGIIYKD